MPRYRVGIDIGGTFTDLCVLDEDTGEFMNRKVSTTPRDLAQGVMQAVEGFLAGGRTAGEVTLLFHASTVATNALLEQRGANTWLVITEGYTGVYETPELSEVRMGSYNYLAYPKPRLLAPPRQTIQIRERVDFQGNVLIPLDESQVRSRLQPLAASEVDAVAICFLFSFMNPEHEQRVRDLVREVAPGARVYVSSETLPQIREYPRLVTTVANAYVAPIVVRYIEKLEHALAARGFSHRLYVMLSTGGCLTTGIVKRIPVSMIESGPAAGALAAAYLGRLTGSPRIISFDMGGTTTKAGIIENGEPRIVSRFQAGEWLLGIPSLDLVEIGSGGGSIAWIDRSGMVKVGPQSAGADPGPACYRQGGLQPTVTDADLVLGWLNPDYFLGGEVALSADAAGEAVRTHIAEPLGLDVTAAADGIIQIVNSQMVEALRLVTVSRGEDPREFIMVAFGGAGPVHAAALAAELKVPRLMVPLAPGVFSAMGLLVSDLKRDYVQTHVAGLQSASVSQIQARFEQMEAAALEELRGEDIPGDAITCDRALDLRYSIQKYELSVPVAAGVLSETHKPQWREQFDQRHEQTFGTRAADQLVEIVSYRLTASVRLPKPDVPAHAAGGADPTAALKGRRQAFFGVKGWLDTPVYDRTHLAAGHRFAGPAIVEQPDCTIVLHPGQAAWVDAFKNVIIETGGGQS